MYEGQCTRCRKTTFIAKNGHCISCVAELLEKPKKAPSFKKIPDHVERCDHPAGCGKETPCYALHGNGHWCAGCGLYKEGCEDLR